jgi:hypothetical protein
MNTVTIVVGALAVGYGLFVLVLRLKGNDEKFRKLAPMRRFWGPKLGSAIHYVGYVGLPIVLGAVLIVAGVKGINVFDALK